MAKCLKQQETHLAKLTGERIKVVERSGLTVKQLLIKSSIWCQPCNNIKCFHCRTIENNYQPPLISSDSKPPPGPDDDEGDKKPPTVSQVDCRLRGTGGHTYLSWCVECSIARRNQQQKWKTEKLKKMNKNEANESKENREDTNQENEEEEANEEEREREKEIKEAIYLGESRRGPGLRSSEHWDDAMASKDTSHVFRHWQESHAGEAMPRFGARVLRFHKTSMSRQISESTLLWRWSKRGDLQILNQKGMYNRCHLARLVVEECVQQEKNDDPGEENGRKGDLKLEDDKKSKGPSIDNESKSTASETNSINNTGNNKKTNKQKNNSADITKYFNQTNRMVKK